MHLNHIQSSCYVSETLCMIGPGRTLSASGGGAPFRAFPKSLSVDFGGLGQQQAALSAAPPSKPAPPSQDKYAPLSQLDSVFSENTPPSTGKACLCGYGFVCVFVYEM